MFNFVFHIFTYMKHLLHIIVFILLTNILFAQQSIKLLNANTFQKTIDSVAYKQIIDVRTPQEFSTGYIAEAKNINFYDKNFKEKLENLDKNQPVFVYCKGGGRSAEAAKLLEASGFNQVYDLDGGILSWTRSGLPVNDIESTDGVNRFTQADYNKLLADHKALLIDFYAPWCIPCRQMEPSLKKLAARYSGKVYIARVNIDEAKQLTQQLNIDAIPVLAAYKDGKEIKRVNGLQSSSNLEKLLKTVLQ